MLNRNGINIPEDELQEQFIRSPGPGGQHVNTSATAVQLRFNVYRSKALPEAVRRRLLHLEENRITQDGDLIIEAHRFRSRERNRDDARERLLDLIQKASRRPKARVATKPSRAAKRRRIEAKKKRGSTKRGRRPPSLD